MLKVSILVVAMLAGTVALAHADPSFRQELISIHNYLYHAFVGLIARMS